MTDERVPDPTHRRRQPVRSAVRRVLQVADILASGDASIMDVLRPGFSLTSARMLARVRGHVPTLRTILDAGANIGQFALAASRAYPEARVLAFEPLPSAASVLRRRSLGTSRIAVHECALGQEAGDATLLQNEYSHVSSILPIHPRNRHPNYDASKVRTLRVKLARLDQLVSAEDLIPPVLLKLDVQGYEKQVLAGAQGILPAIEYLVVEAAFATLYEGQATFDELHQMLSDAGFAFVAPVGFQQGAKGVVIEMDGLYRRRRP